MKKTHLILLVLFAAALTSCSTVQYSARQVDVQRRNIGTHEQMAGVTVDYTRQVTATSDYQMTRNDAIQEAEFLCLQNAKIDVVIDPIYKVEYNPFKFKRRFKATIIGFAGKYKSEPTRLDKSKEYTREEIENFKLLYDPTFPQYFYNKAQGDNYYFGNGGSSSFFKKEPKPVSLLLSPKGKLNPKLAGKPQKQFDYYQSKRLRDVGIGLMVGGALMNFAIGMPLIMVGASDEMSTAGMAFSIVGGLTFVTGIPVLSVGAVRMKKSQQQSDITLNAGNNGIGLGFTF